jgi:hypothetical protein
MFLLYSLYSNCSNIYSTVYTSVSAIFVLCGSIQQYVCVENLRADVLEEVFNPKIKHMLILWGAGGVTCFVLMMLYLLLIGAIYFISWMLFL